MTNSSAVVYQTEQTCHVDLAMFEKLRASRRFFDLRILTLEKEEIEAHRFALATRFPHIWRNLPTKLNYIVDWNRFPTAIIKAALDYAYTGQVVVTEETALPLFLFALNLGCRDIQDCCLKFLESRIKEENLAHAWSVANATRNEALIDLCLPALRDHLEAFIEMPRFMEATNSLGMARILLKPTFEAVDSTAAIEDTPKHRLLTKWLRGLAPFDAEQSPTQHLESLLHNLDLSLLTFNTLSSLLEASAEYKLSTASKTEIRAALKSLTSTQPTLSCSSKELLHLLTETDVNELHEVRALDPFTEYAKSEVTVRIRPASAVVLHGGYLCVVEDPSPEYDRAETFILINLKTKEITRGPRLPRPLISLYAVGCYQGFYLFGFEIGYHSLNAGFFKYSFEKDRWVEKTAPPTNENCEAAFFQSGVALLYCSSITSYLWGNSTGIGEWRWRKLTNMKSRREKPGITYFRDRFFVAGGNTGGRFDVETLKWPLETGKEPQWTVISSFDVAHQSPHNLSVYGGHLLLICIF